MDSDKNMWRIWVGFLQRWGLCAWISTILEVIGPFSIFGAQIIHLGRPFLNQSVPSNHLDALIRLLENENQKQAFLDFLSEAPAL